MQFDRWILPPAVAVAVFTTLAIVPPVTTPGHGIRIEQLDDPREGRPWLVRVAIDEGGGLGWSAPSHVRFDASGAATSGTVVTHRTNDARERYVAVPLHTAGRTGFIVRADGLEARFTAMVAHGTPGSRIESPQEVPGAGDANTLGLHVAGGGLVPEIPSELWLHAPGRAGAALRIVPTDATVRIDPPTVRLDGCGLARTTVTVDGLDAHVRIVDEAGSTLLGQRRLLVTPGQPVLNARPDANDAIEVRAPIGGSLIYLVGGDATGPLWWDAKSLGTEPDGSARARIGMPAQTAWLVASFSPVFEARVARWRSDPPFVRCRASEMGRAFARATTITPFEPRFRVVYDGAARAETLRAVERARMRSVSVVLATLSMLLLMALVLLSGVRADPSVPRVIAQSTARRVAVALGGTAALAVGAVLLWLTYLLRR